MRQNLLLQMLHDRHAQIHLKDRKKSEDSRNWSENRVKSSIRLTLIPATCLDTYHHAKPDPWSALSSLSPENQFPAPSKGPDIDKCPPNSGNSKTLGITNDKPSMRECSQTWSGNENLASAVNNLLELFIHQATTEMMRDRLTTNSSNTLPGSSLL